MVRLKHRYIICQLLEPPGQSNVSSTAFRNSSSSSSATGVGTTAAAPDFNMKDVQSSIREKVESLFGEVGAGTYGSTSMVKAYDAHSRLFVIRTASDAEHNLRLAIACVSTVKTKAVIIRSLSVAGSTRTCMDKLRGLFSTVVECSSLSDELKVERLEHYRQLLSTLEL